MGNEPGLQQISGKAGVFSSEIFEKNKYQERREFFTNEIPETNNIRKGGSFSAALNETHIFCLSHTRKNNFRF
jgi:hypothetical protein